MMPSKPHETVYSTKEATREALNPTVDAIDSDESMEAKDAAEVELERLLFGDDAGFYDGLRAHQTAQAGGKSLQPVVSGEDEVSERQKEELEGINDADVRLTASAVLVARARLIL